MRWQAGQSAKLPIDALYHHIARRYGQTPGSVRAWPADDFMDAVSFDPFLTPPATKGKR